MNLRHVVHGNQSEDQFVRGARKICEVVVFFTVTMLFVFRCHGKSYSTAAGFLQTFWIAQADSVEET